MIPGSPFLGNFPFIAYARLLSNRHMRSRIFIVVFCLLLCLLASANAGVYPLNDGSALSGEPISFNETGLIVRQSDGGVSSRTPWTQFSQDALKQLLADAKTPKDKAFVEPFIEEIVEQAAKRKEIVIKPAPKVERPNRGIGLSAGFSSPVFLTIFAILYLANLYAAYEIAQYKYQPTMLVCGIAAILPGLGPILFLCLPAKPDPMRDTTADAPQPAVVEEAPVIEPVVSDAPVSHAMPRQTPASHVSAGENANIPHAQPAPAQPSFPAPIVFHRSEFSFNRRFFETKLAGFFRVIPGEAEKDMVIAIKSLRGDFVGKRITRVTPAELYLQVFKDNATHDEMIPFTEVQEVRIRHKDAA